MKSVKQIKERIKSIDSQMLEIKLQIEKEKNFPIVISLRNKLQHKIDLKNNLIWVLNK
jgi:hypothetical protein